MMAALVLAGLSGLSGAAQAQVFLPYLNAPPEGAPITAPPRLFLSFGGARRAAVMDTGSTGIVVSASAIPRVEALPGLGPGTLTYSSSGRIMRGRWVRVAATIAGKDGAAVTTAPLPVLAVDRVDCLPHARDCIAGPARDGIAMLGIGFGRQGDHQAQSTPDRNPFLNLAGLNLAASASGRGYVVTRSFVQIGLTEAARQGFATVQLARSKLFPDWEQAPVCISVDDAAPACGVALMDTGVVAMYLGLPGRARGTLPPGTRLRFDLPDAAAPVASYSLTAGDTGSPLSPERIVPVPHAAAFVNTSVRFLNGFDFLYDADRGLVGYRKRAGG
jgi:hypothetical protein